MKLRSVRGTHDIFGEVVTDKFNFISNIVSKNANLKEYKEIQTPIFESVIYLQNFLANIQMLF